MNQEYGRPRVLIVDDEPRVLRSLDAALKPRFDIAVAEDANQAPNILLESEEQFEVIVSDERMPRCTGLTLLKWASENRPHTVRILLTGSDLSKLQESIRSVGVYKCMSKPWNIEEFQKTLDQAALRSRTLVRQAINEQQSFSTRQCFLAVVAPENTDAEFYRSVGQNLLGILGTHFFHAPGEVTSAMSQVLGLGVGVLIVDLMIGVANAVKLIGELNETHGALSIIVVGEPGAISVLMKTFEQLRVYQYVPKPASIERMQSIVLSGARKYMYASFNKKH